MKSTGRKMQVSKQLSSLVSINKNNKNIKFLRARQLPEENNIIFRCLHLHEAVILFCPRSVGLKFLAIAWPLIDWGDVRAVLSREMTLKKTPDTPVTDTNKLKGKVMATDCPAAVLQRKDWTLQRYWFSSVEEKQLQNLCGPELIFDWNEQYQPPLIHHLGKAGSAGQNAPSLSISSKQPFHFALPTANTGIFNLQFISVCQRWKALSN